jgi:DNA-binding response OmpR family regulator
VPRVLLATDADWLRDEVEAALADEHTTVSSVRAGRDVTAAMKVLRPDLVLLDLQIGAMGGMATCMALRLEESGDRLPHVPIVMLLDRRADEFLARRCGADAWLVKPIEPLRLSRLVQAVLAGEPAAPASPSATTTASG